MLMEPGQLEAEFALQLVSVSSPARGYPQTST